MSVRGWMPMLLGALLTIPIGVAAAQETVERPGWLGFTYEASRENGRERVRVDQVYPRSPAAAAGLRKSDEIVRWNGRADVGQALEALWLEPGDSVRLRIRRGEARERDLVVVADRRPPRVFSYGPAGEAERFGFSREDAERLQRELKANQEEIERLFRDQAWPDSIRIDTFWVGDAFGRTLKLHADSLHRGLQLMLRDSLGPQLQALAEDFRWVPEAGARAVAMMGRRSVAGAEFEEMNSGLSAYFGTDEGALVLRVSPGTPAARAGLQPGDVVLQADDREVDSIEDLRTAVARAQKQRPRAVQLEILRRGRRQELDLRWE